LPDSVVPHHDGLLAPGQQAQGPFQFLLQFPGDVASVGLVSSDRKGVRQGDFILVKGLVEADQRPAGGADLSELAQVRLMASASSLSSMGRWWRCSRAWETPLHLLGLLRTLMGAARVVCSRWPFWMPAGSTITA